MKVNVVAVAGANCITLAHGQAVYDVIRPRLDRGEAVDLDFTGVAVVASPFLNAAIGRLLRDFDADRLNELVKFSSLPPVAWNLLKRVISNSRQYYQDPSVRSTLDDILTEGVDRT